ncbi:uncharacterized protein LALA0_S09e07052g [Lachancea lanzarotensis]|uniref:LALA0S09e07052g1_1 n=1 Tax=Lachancea lanzarotensis TaxID=1245769 RepID=A0A0C7MVK9_9SACH|nr:uncharacterized protein LALA0_S09e07052g [Lachancea lanzarotensis]CEP63986.1 LALA0S09e07052g1_1 [Lachancea lanzarotensis]
MAQTAVTRLQQHHQQQREETIIRDARIRLDLKKTFMDDELFFPENKLSPGSSMNITGTRDSEKNSGNLQAMLRLNLPLGSKTENGKTSSETNGRFVSQQYYQNQLLAAVQQQQQQHQQHQQHQQQHHHHQRQQRQPYHQNPYLNNSGFQMYASQHDVGTAKGHRDW